MQRNYYKLRTHNPFRNEYMYLDVADYLADELFIEHKVKVKFMHELANDASKYMIIHCSIRKKDSDEFLAALEELYNKMLLMGYKDYEESCNKIIGAFKHKENEKGK